MEAFFSMFLLSYFLYAVYMIYSLIPIGAQILFSYCIDKKQIWKITFLAFLDQGIVIQIASFIYEILKFFKELDENYTINNLLVSNNFKFDIVYLVILTAIIFVIGFFSYKSIDRKMSCRRWIAFIGGFLINIVITMLLMYKFKIYYLGF